MDLQDEGRIAPDEEQRQYVGGISEFARLEEERAELIAAELVHERDELRKQVDGEFVPEPFAEGAKSTNPKDVVATGKAPLSYVPLPVLYEIGAGMLEGARKYGGHNYRRAGVRASVYFNATMRHLAAWFEGEDIDPDSGLSHITKAITSLVVLRDAEMNGMIVNDDRPPRAPAGWMREVTEKVRAIMERHPDPVDDFTERAVCLAAEPAGPEFSLTVKLPVRDTAGEVYDFRENVLESILVRDRDHGEALMSDLAGTLYVGRIVSLYQRGELVANARRVPEGEGPEVFKP